MGERGVFFFTARYGRLARGAQQMNLRLLLVLADIHPKAGDTGNLRPRAVRLHSENVGVEAPRRFNFLRLRSNPDTMMVQLDHFNWHGVSLPAWRLSVIT